VVVVVAVVVVAAVVSGIGATAVDSEVVVVVDESVWFSPHAAKAKAHDSSAIVEIDFMMVIFGMS
jgi:hypothetical protein